MRKTLYLALVACALILTPLAVRANNVSENYIVQILPGSEVPHTFPSPPTIAQFNSTLGTLNSVNITLTGTDSWSLFRGTGSLDADLVYDGFSATQDFAPGAMTFNLSGTLTSGLADFIGTGNYTLELELNLPDGTGSIGATTLNGTVNYDYTPANAAPEPSSFMLLSVVMLGAVWIEQKRLFARTAR